MKNVLIIGGTNKTAINIAHILESNNYSIDCMTYRYESNIINIDTTWEHLDIFEDKSVNLFLEKQNKKIYDKIILFISNSIKPYGEHLMFNDDDLKNFYGIFCVNYIKLINGLKNCISDDGSIIFISSSAAEMGCKDPVYSSGKALIQSYILSLNNFLNNSQSAFSISPGTIFGSNFFISLADDNPIKTDLECMTYPEELSKIIMYSHLYKGRVIKAGWGKGWES